MRQYYLGPWVWDDSDPSEPFYRAPEGTIGLVDLRGADRRNGLGFFATDRLVVDRNYIGFGDGINRIEDVTLNVAQRSLWSSAIGIGPLTGNRLVDALWETLALHGDPDGGALCKPLIPTHKGILELHLGGHSLIRSERFTGPQHPSWSRVQSVVQRNYRSIRTEAMRNHRGPGAPNIHSKYLECMSRKLRCQWEDLIPSDLPRENPRRPTTTITDDFNRASLGSNWTSVDGTGQIVTSTTFRGNADGSDLPATLRYDATDLSSDDHYAQIDFTAQEDVFSHLCGAVRFNASADTCYVGRIRAQNTQSFIEKVETGTRTSLTTDTSGAGPPHTGKLQVDGSSLTLYMDDSEVSSVTDTAITGNLRVGLSWTHNKTSDGDNFEAGDLVAGNAFALNGPFAGPLVGPFG